MKERPIIFSGEMVRAILAGRKTQTRRVVKPQPVDDPSASMPWVDEGPSPSGAGRMGRSLRLDECPFGQPGDMLWVRETIRPSGMVYVYDADQQVIRLNLPKDPGAPVETMLGRDPIKDRRPIPSIHMPRWASRLTLRVTDVRVERVQEISEADAIAEGCDGSCEWAGAARCDPTGDLVGNQFITLWDSINAARAPWASNPWVWVVEFETINP